MEFYTLNLFTLRAFQILLIIYHLVFVFTWLSFTLLHWRKISIRDSRNLASRLEQILLSILIINNTDVSYLSGHPSPLKKKVWVNRGKNLSFRLSPVICRMTLASQHSHDEGIWTRMSNILQFCKSGVLSRSPYLNPHEMPLYYRKHLIQISWMDKLKNPHIKISEEKRTTSPLNSYCLREKKKNHPAIFFHPLALANSKFMISAAFIGHPKAGDSLHSLAFTL